jgi:hypothetical protein
MCTGIEFGRARTRATRNTSWSWGVTCPQLAHKPVRCMMRLRRPDKAGER